MYLYLELIYLESLQIYNEASNQDNLVKRRSSVEIPSSLSKVLPSKIISKLSRVNTLNSKEFAKIENNKKQMYKSNKEIQSHKAEKINFDASNFKYLKHVPIRAQNEVTEPAEISELNKINSVYLK